MRRIGEHAVVIGGSMAGLLAARALTDAYERVTVLDRDTLPDGFEGRRAIPQGRHAHALLPHGQACLDALLPRFSDELVAAGAPTCEALAETRFVIGGHRLARASTGAHSLLASRPFIEGHVRRRVRRAGRRRAGRRLRRARALTARRRRSGSPACGSCGAPTAARRSCSRPISSSSPTGRGARLPAWLEGLGFERPAEDRLAIGVTYASRHLRLPGGALEPEKLILIGAVPDRPRTLFLFAQEGGRWILSLGGYGAEHRPPADPDGFAAFAATVAPPDVLRRDRGRRAARRDRDARLPRERPAPLRTAAPLPRGPARHRRRDLLVQPHVRSGHDGRRRRGGRAARVPGGRRARAGAAVLPRRDPRRSTTRGRCRSAPTSRCRRCGAAARRACGS